MTDDYYERIRAEVTALSGDALRGYLADMMGQSIAAGAVPRDVILSRLARMPDEELRATVIQAADAALEMQRIAAARGCVVGVVYDEEELERVRKIQRELKE